MIVVVDNYDSFTWNLVHLVAACGEDVRVVQNDAVTVNALCEMRPDALLLSPGPGTPDDAGITMDVVRTLGGRVPIWGVCLGHQSIAQAFGARVVRAKAPMHGRVSSITHDEKGLFCGVSSPLSVMRYHSLVVDEATLPPELTVTARTDDGEIMGLRHVDWPMESVQFHPESFLSEHGPVMARNFVNWRVREGRDR